MLPMKDLVQTIFYDTKANINNINLSDDKGQTQSKQSQELHIQDGELNIAVNNTLDDRRIYDYSC